MISIKSEVITSSWNYCLRSIFCLMFLSSSINLYAQKDLRDTNCYVIKFIGKKYVDSAIQLSPEYHPNGFYLVANGVYDFVIDGKKYYQSILLGVEKDTFHIVKNWESTNNSERILDTLSFSIKQAVQIRLLSIHNGVGGIPFRTKIEDYLLSIIPTEKYCRMKYVELIGKDQTYNGHFYFTSLGLKAIKMVKGKAYFVEPKGEYILRRN
jgi:hypothetical protein